MNIALMAQLDVYESDTVEEALASPQWCDAMKTGISFGH